MYKIFQFFHIPCSLHFNNKFLPFTQLHNITHLNIYKITIRVPKIIAFCQFYVLQQNPFFIVIIIIRSHSDGNNKNVRRWGQRFLNLFDATLNRFWRWRERYCLLVLFRITLHAVFCIMVCGVLYCKMMFTYTIWCGEVYHSWNL